MGRRVDEELLTQPVAGFNVASGATLGDLIGPGAGGPLTVLVFLRHHG